MASSFANSHRSRWRIRSPTPSAHMRAQPPPIVDRALVHALPAERCRAGAETGEAEALLNGPAVGVREEAQPAQLRRQVESDRHVLRCPQRHPVHRRVVGVPEPCRLAGKIEVDQTERDAIAHDHVLRCHIEVPDQFGRLP